MVLDGRSPVIVGVGQVVQRIESGEGREPADLLADAFRVAEADAAGSGDLAAAADSIRVLQILSWRYRDPARLVAERIGATPRHTCTRDREASCPRCWWPGRPSTSRPAGPTWCSSAGPRPGAAAPGAGPKAGIAPGPARPTTSNRAS